MSFLLSKALPLVVLPLGVVLCALLVAAVTRRRSIVVAAAVLLWTASMPLTGRAAWSMVEGDWTRPTVESLGSADAIVVLSGSRTLARSSSGPSVSEWDDADRFFGGLEAFDAGVAPRLVFTGGFAPWDPAAPLEGTVLRDWAMRFGVPADAIVTTGPVTNTAEEAAAVATLLGVDARPGQTPESPGPRMAPERRPSIVLVTSAFHVPRAMALFERSGFDVVPFPVDRQESAGRTFALIDLLPSAEGLVSTSRALREILGRIVYGVPIVPAW